MTDPRFPFTPGSAREIKDPAAEMARLAATREPAEMEAIPRADLAVLIAFAHQGAALYADDPAKELPSDVTLDEAVRVLERYVNY